MGAERFSREIKPIGVTYEIYYKELAHVIMEAERCQDQDWACWRPGRTYMAVGV